MTAFFCGLCGTQLELIPGKYSLYYKCPECKSKFSLQTIVNIENVCKSGEFRNNNYHAKRVKEKVETIDRLYVRRVKKNGNDIS